MINSQSLSTSLRCQSGVSLIISLIFLVVLTLLATAGVRTTMQQERMAGNGVDMNISFQAAELAIRQAEIYAGGGLRSEQFNALCSNGLCSTLNLPYWADIATWADGAGEKFVRVDLASTALANMDPPLAASPKYMIEYAGQAKDDGSDGATANGSSDVFRIVTHAVGTNAKTETNVMTTYLVPSL